MQRMTWGVIVLLLALAGFLYYAAPSRPTVSLQWGPPLATAVPVAGLERGDGPNLAAQVADFSGGRWKPDAVAIVPAVAVAPDGSNTADRLVETPGNRLHRIETTVTGATPGTVHTLSLFAKPAERAGIEFEMRDKDPGKYGRVHFDLRRREVTFEGGDVSEAGLEALPDGWYRCWAAMAFSGDTVVFTFGPLGAHDALLHAGSRSAGLLIWGVQFEPGRRPRGYAKTRSQ